MFLFQRDLRVNIFLNIVFSFQRDLQLSEHFPIAVFLFQRDLQVYIFLNAVFSFQRDLQVDIFLMPCFRFNEIYEWTFS